MVARPRLFVKQPSVLSGDWVAHRMGSRKLTSVACSGAGVPLDHCCKHLRRLLRPVPSTSPGGAMARGHRRKPVEKRSRKSTSPGGAADWTACRMGHTSTAMQFRFVRRTSVAPPGLVCFPCLRSTAHARGYVPRSLRDQESIAELDREKYGDTAPIGIRAFRKVYTAVASGLTGKSGRGGPIPN